MEAIQSQINLKVKNNTSLAQPVSILGVVPNSNTANNNNLLYEFDLTGQSFVGITNVSINISNTSNPTIVVNTVQVTTQSIQGIVYALNTLNQGLFSYSGSIIYVSSNYYIYSNISIAGSSILGTTFGTPEAIAIDSLGNIYTADTFPSPCTITKITPSGVSSVFATLTIPATPTCIVIDASDNLYVGCISTDDVKKITPLGVVTVYGTTGLEPIAIIIDSLGTVFTANRTSNNVSKITSLGISTILGTTGAIPSGLVLDSLGNIFTSNNSSSNISKITPLGISTIFATTGTNPQRITIDNSDNLYTANSGSNNVSKITSLGVSTILGTTGLSPSSIAIDSSNNLYTANIISDNVSKITQLGASSIIGTTGIAPYAIVVDNFSNVYTANNGDNTVTIIVQ